PPCLPTRHDGRLFGDFSLGLDWIADRFRFELCNAGDRESAPLRPARRADRGHRSGGGETDAGDGRLCIFGDARGKLGFPSYTRNLAFGPYLAVDPAGSWSVAVHPGGAAL